MSNFLNRAHLQNLLLADRAVIFSGYKVTFFVLGENVERHPEILKRAVAEGHEIGNHTWLHPNLAKLSQEKVHGQLQGTDDLIRQTIGFRPKIMRPPYGSLTS